MATTPKKIDLTPQELDLVLYSGDGIVFNVIVKDSEAEPVNLTGTLIAQIRNKRGASGDPITAFDVDLSDRVDGVAKLKLTGVKTQLLTPESKKFNGYWDLQWTPEDEEPRTLCQGSVECDPDVSR